MLALADQQHHNAPRRPPLAGKGNPGPRDPNPYQQATRLQRVIFKAANEPNVKAAALSSLARAWSDLEETKRVLKMKFKPGDLRAADLDPIKQAWWIKRARRANKGHVTDLPKAVISFDDETEAELAPARKALSCGPDTPTGSVPPNNPKPSMPQEAAKP